MKTLVFIGISLFISIAHTNAQKRIVQKTTKSPFQGIKEFCSFSKPIKFKLSVTGNGVITTKTYKDNTSRINGIMKNGNVYTNSPSEKRNHIASKYYLLTSSSLSINNLEGGR
ncbi:MAG TPA: hypothetical protein VKA92_12280 [Segetibacter sp.]|nr:hypothetical protein [Segetibacter sp.]